ncbi:hypothetical protein [Lacticaseibacillus camelliae]|uniref:hypothetical protein n=1 Tax=Lacticaseibacillus camelliae TaxID=381742 RepID=UPI000B22CB87|nr:hypothetical protein [Lacticaseibacillus camelliae]
MQLVEAVLLLISLVIVSNVISHYLVVVPVSLIQVALGLGAALFFQAEPRHADGLVHAAVHGPAFV